MSASSEQIFIGIDVSKALLDLAIRAQSKACQFANTEEGIGALLASLEPLRRSVAVVLMEATGGLEDPAAVALCVAGYPRDGRQSQAGTRLFQGARLLEQD
jgi:transposase